MSDGRTDAYRGMRKATYLEQIELKKDNLFDEHLELTNDLIIYSSEVIDVVDTKKTFFGSKKIDYKEFDRLNKKIFELKIKLREKEKLIKQLDREYKDALSKPLKEF